MKIIRYTLFLLITIILQCSWPNSLDFYGLRPDLIMLVVLFAGLRHGSLLGMALGAIGGLFQDMYSPQDLGLNMFLKSTVGFTIGYIRKRLAYDNNLVVAILLFNVSLIHDFIFYIGSTAIHLADIPGFMLRYGIGRALLTTVFGLIYTTGFKFRNRLLSE